MSNQDWHEILAAQCAHEKAEKLMKTFQDAMDNFFPEKTKKIRDTDDPWITDQIWRRIRTRKKKFKKEERSENSKTLKEETTRLIRESKADYYKKYTELAKETGDPALYYKVVNRLKDRQSPHLLKLQQCFPTPTLRPYARRWPISSLRYQTTLPH